MRSPILLDDSFLVGQLRKGDRQTFEVIFNFYYSGLVVYADKILDDVVLSEDIVQAVFMKLWENRKQLSIHSLRSYLATTVKNRCIDLIRSKQVKNRYLDKVTTETIEETTDDFLTYTELKQVIDDAVSKLPPRCKEIFELNRYQGLKIKEIAIKLDISPRTAETQISKALRILRVELKDYLSYALVMFFLH